MDIEQLKELYNTFGYEGHIRNDIDRTALDNRLSAADEAVNRDFAENEHNTSYAIRLLLFEMGIIQFAFVGITDKNGVINLQQYNNIKHAAENILEYRN